MSTMLSIIVPCYNEEDALPLFYTELKRILQNMACSHELLLIDDGSSDSTLHVMKHLAEIDNRVHYVAFSRNFGKEAALYAGLRHAKGDYVVAMDADMQHPPSMLVDMMHTVQHEDCDCVAARRLDRRGEGSVKSWFSKIFYKIVNKASETEIVDGATDFRIMNRHMVNAVLELAERDRFSKGIFAWVGFKTQWVSFPNTERIAGNTKWGFGKLAQYALHGIVSFSETPVHAILWLGIAITTISFVVFFINAIRQLFFSFTVSEISYATCILSAIGGILLTGIGILGQYVIGIFRETKQRPHYIISQTDLSNVSDE